MQYLVALFTIVAVACGPSSKEVATAKSARYQGDKLMLFATTKAAVESKYKLAKSDETTLGMQTQPRWYSPEGLATSASIDDERDIPDKSINLALVVTLLPDGNAWIVKVMPVMQRKNAGMPKPDTLKEGDPSVPGWIESKVDQLALDIHNALAKYQVQQPGGIAPAPAPSPDEPSGSAAAPSQGSAAPAAPAAGSAAP
ncbi:MAG TPA: hypothetical protein VIV40_05090 [Kofleriaceae bacterium]